MRKRKYARLRLERLESRNLLSAFFVATTGDDAAAGDVAHPWATLQHAADSVQAGDVVHVATGNYSGFDLSVGGSVTNPISFLADPGVFITSPEAGRHLDGIDIEDVTGAGNAVSNVTIQGFNISNMPEAGIRAVSNSILNSTNIQLIGNTINDSGSWGIFTSHEDNLLIEGNTCSNSQTQHGIYISNACINPHLTGNIIFGNAGSGIQMTGDAGSGDSGIISGALVEDNTIHDNGSGINCDGVQNSVFRNNLLYNNHASGISLYRTAAAQASLNNTVVNNTFVMASDAGWAVNISDGSTGNIVFNNILFNNNPNHGSIAITSDSLSGFFSNNNVVNGSGNTAPVIVSTAPTTPVSLGQTYNYSVQALDADGDPLQYSLATVPDGMTIDPTSGQLNWDTGTLGQWASSVIDYSSQYSATDWSAAQALGAPNTNAYYPTQTAWNPRTNYGTNEFLELGYAVPVHASGVMVRENWGAGFVTQIDLLDTNNVLHTVWQGTDNSPDGVVSDFTVGFDSTPYLVKGVKIYVTNSIPSEGPEIDAVRLIEQPVAQWASSVIDYSSQVTSYNYAAIQALGEPNTSQYNINPTAWAPPTNFGTNEFLELGFGIPVHATGVDIRETLGNGFVTQIDLLDTNNVLHTVFQGTDPTLPGQIGDFVVSFASTPYLVKGVKVYVTEPVNAFNIYPQIDAVQLFSDVTAPVSVRVDDGHGNFDTQNFNVTVTANPLGAASGVVSSGPIGSSVQDNPFDLIDANGQETLLSLAAWQSATGQDTNSSQASPAQLFLNMAGNDYHLQAGTAAIDNGLASFQGAAAPTLDLDGQPRPFGNGFDIGAYELQSIVTQQATTTSLATSAASPTFGTSVTFTATVSGNSGTPTGTVTFMDGAVILGTSTLNGGEATLTTSSLAVGAHAIKAVYGGDSNFLISTSAPVTESVAQASSTTSLSSTADFTTLGQMITFTAKVTSNVGSPTGNVTFMDGSTALATIRLGSGLATFITSSLGVGTHSITAVYGGDASYEGSSSGTLVESIGQASSSTMLATSADPVDLGQAVTFTASVTSSGGTPSGTVTFMDGSSILGSATLNGGIASMTTSSLTVGSHSVTAVYGGDANVVGSTSAAVAESVAPATPTTSLDVSAASIAFGQSVMFTATVSSSAGTPTGTATFQDGSTILGSIALSSGQATFSTSSLAVGSHSITVVYGGDPNFTGSTSVAVPVSVTTASSSTSLSSSSPDTGFGQSVTFTAAVSSSVGSPSGTVTFMDGSTALGTGTLSNGQATFTTSSLAVGSHAITAVYGGDSNFQGSTSATMVESVAAASSTTSLAASATSISLGQSVTFTATVTSLAGTPSGSVTFQDGSTVLGTASLVGGQATFATSALAAGSHAISAVYVGSTNIAGSTSAAVTETVTATTTTVAINAGGGSVGGFLADTDFHGGTTYTTRDAINTSKVTNPAPQAVFQSERYGNFTYTMPNLTPGASYVVRLDFAEIYWNAANKRIFDVSINGREALEHFDIFKAAGGKDIAIARTFLVRANSAGKIVITFTSIRDNAKVSGIEISPAFSPVNLAGAFNEVGIVRDGTFDGGLGGTSLRFDHQTFTLGAPNTNNVVSAVGQTIDLPGGQYAALYFLATAVNGPQRDLTFTVHYTDGTSQIFTQSVSDGRRSHDFRGETPVATLAYRDNRNGGRERQSVQVYGYRLALNTTKTVASITLPNDRNVGILAMNLGKV